MPHTRRLILAALGAALPFGLASRAGAASPPVRPALTLRFRSFEEAVRAAFATSSATCHRVEVGASDLIQAGVQGSHNARPFAGFPTGHLRITRTGSEPGPTWQGVRLYVTTVDVTLTTGPTPHDPSRPLDFASLPAAPVWG